MSSEVTPQISSHEFRRACGRFATGVTIATVLDHQGNPHGLTVSSFTSVSLEPPLVSICIGHAVSMFQRFKEASAFGINILREEQRDLSDRFARKSEDRFGGLVWRKGVTDVPLLEGVLATLECAVEQRITVGDHDVLVGRVVATHVTEGKPLLYFASNYHAGGDKL